VTDSLELNVCYSNLFINYFDSNPFFISVNLGNLVLQSLLEYWPCTFNVGGMLIIFEILNKMSEVSTHIELKMDWQGCKKFNIFKSCTKSVN